MNKQRVIVTPTDCIFLTKGLFNLLESNGFYVQSAQEAYLCLKNIVEAQVASDVHQSMEELKCQNCQVTSGLKNIDQIN